MADKQIDDIEIKKDNHTLRMISYGIILTFCIVSIFVGVYENFFARVSDNNNSSGKKTDDVLTEIDKAQDELRQFKNLFKNNYDPGNFTGVGIIKNINNQDIVYDFANRKEKVDGKFDIEAHIPYINIKNNVCNMYNQKIYNIYGNEVNKVRTQSTEFTTCTIKYTAYVTNNILSVAIYGMTKDGQKPQRTYISTYNYDLTEGKDVPLTYILAQRGLNPKQIEDAVKKRVKKISDDSKAMANSGFEEFQRDPNSSMYKVENMNNFMQGPNGELYIIFSYGNNANTSAVDVIEF